MKLVIEKAHRRLALYHQETLVFSCRIGLGQKPVGPKCAEGDGRTPEGRYFICLVKEAGKYGRSLGLSYPGPADAHRALNEGLIDERTLENILLAHQQHRRPPWGSPLGGEIYLHEGGSFSDWTQGCIALDAVDMDALFPYRDQIEEVCIEP